MKILSYRKRLKKYEARKAQLQKLGLPPKEYETAIKDLAAKLKL